MCLSKLTSFSSPCKQPGSSSDGLLGNWDEGSNDSFDSQRFLQQDNSIHDSALDDFTGQTIDTGQEMGQISGGHGTQHLSLMQQLQVQNRNGVETNNDIPSEFTGQSVYQGVQLETSSSLPASGQLESTQSPPQGSLAAAGNNNLQEINWTLQPQPQGQELFYALQMQHLLEQTSSKQHNTPAQSGQEDMMRQLLLVPSSNCATLPPNPYQDQLVQYLLNAQQQLNINGTGGNQSILMQQQLQMFRPQNSLPQADHSSHQLLQASSQPPSNQHAQPIKHKSPPKPSKSEAAKTPRRSKTKIQNSSKTKAVIANHREATQVIGNTMKSLNNTIRSIHEITGSEPAQVVNKSRKRQMISGSMKSLSSTLAITMMAPPETRGNASWDMGNNGECCTEPLRSTLKSNDLIQTKFEQQDVPIKAYPHVHCSPPEMNESYSTMLSRNTEAIAANMNLVSSDTDCELFSMKNRSKLCGHQEAPVIPDRYLTESGTDDESMLLGVPINAPTATSDEKLKLTK
jgi:hypothetical protein